MSKATVAERIAAGRALRDRVPREDHGKWKPAPTRTEPIFLLEMQAKCRLSKFVPIRHGRMATSPFAFLRGSAAMMAEDLSATPRTDVHVQACGDCHLSNFGVFATPERALVFGINDFDETYPGPWEWDVKRLGASVMVAGRFLGLSDDAASEAVRATTSAYRTKMRTLAPMSHLALWYKRITADQVLAMLAPDVRKRARRVLEKARRRTNVQALEKLTERSEGGLRIAEDQPLIVREEVVYDGTPVREALRLAFDQYVPTLASDRRLLFERYRVVDMARKVVGVGSVGLFAWVVLLVGQDEKDPLVLQIKEAQQSVLQPWLRHVQYPCEGERVVAGQRLLQGAPDIFLGWGRWGRTANKDFYVRQLRDMKGSVTMEPGVVGARLLKQYGAACGTALALAHARSGDPAVIAGYLGKSEVFDNAIVRFAAEYADQTNRDHELLTAAIQSGRLEAVLA